MLSTASHWFSMRSSLLNVSLCRCAWRCLAYYREGWNHLHLILRLRPIFARQGYTYLLYRATLKSCFPLWRSSRRIHLTVSHGLLWTDSFQGCGQVRSKTEFLGCNLWARQEWYLEGHQCPPRTGCHQKDLFQWDGYSFWTFRELRVLWSSLRLRVLHSSHYSDQKQY